MKKIFSIIFLFLFTNLFAQREFYELRTYEIKWGTNSQILNNFLKNSFLPALNKNKVKNIGVFTKISNDLPNNIYVLIPYSSIDHFKETYFSLQNDKDFKKASLELNSLSNSKVPYERYSVSHFYAFEGFPKIRKPEKGMSIFELRHYESPTDDAYLRKVKMFNKGEFEIFDDVGLNSVFYGEKISGENMPLLSYMLVHESMELRSKAWGKFVVHPKWIEMKAMNEYKTISMESLVSNITSVFLKELDYSQL